MEKYDYKSVKQDRYRRSTMKEHPSFSSTLLDSIYRSIDENNGGSTEQLQEFEYCRDNSTKNIYLNSSEEENLANIKRACLIEKLAEKKKASTDQIGVGRRKSMPDFNGNSIFSLSTSSNSDSSFSSNLSSNEADQSVYGVNSSNFSMFQKPKPIRTNVSLQNNLKIEQQIFNRESSSNKLAKTKSRALKIYNDLKKAKQPISPGGRLASFLNSLFANGNLKKKISTSSEKTKSKSAYSSACSSASSFSRSCLSKTPSSSRSNFTNRSMKRSVRFYPESVILDEDCRPVGHKTLHEVDDSRFAAEVKNVHNARENVTDLMKNYQKHREDFDMKYTDVASDDDDASCASSDLFELDHLEPIEIDCYSEELPVYETTHFGMNRSIAKGLLV